MSQLNGGNGAVTANKPQSLADNLRSITDFVAPHATSSAEKQKEKKKKRKLSDVLSSGNGEKPSVADILRKITETSKKAQSAEMTAAIENLIPELLKEMKRLAAEKQTCMTYEGRTHSPDFMKALREKLISDEFQLYVMYFKDSNKLSISWHNKKGVKKQKKDDEVMSRMAMDSFLKDNF